MVTKGWSGAPLKNMFGDSPAPHSRPSRTGEPPLTSRPRQPHVRGRSPGPEHSRDQPGGALPPARPPRSRGQSSRRHKEHTLYGRGCVLLEWPASPRVREEPWEKVKGSRGPRGRSPAGSHRANAQLGGATLVIRGGQ